MKVVGNLAFIAFLTSGVEIIDVSDPTQMTRRSTYEPPLGSHNLAIVGDRRYVAGGYAGLRIVDISNPAAPTELGSFLTATPTYGLDVVGDLAYLGTGEAGLAIVDVGDPTQPALVGSYNTSGQTMGMQVVGDLVYVADGGAGLWILDIHDPTQPTLLYQYITSFATDIRVVGNRVYVIAGNNGLHVLWHARPSTAVIGPAGGTLLASDGTVLTFPAGAFAAPTQVTHLACPPRSLPPTGSLTQLDHCFELSAVDLATGQEVAPTRPYTLQVQLTATEVSAAVAENLTLVLCWWNGSRWVEEPGSVTDLIQGTIVATPDHFSLWAVLGKPAGSSPPFLVFMPLLRR